MPISQLRVAAQCCISPSKSNVFAIISTLFIFATATFGATLVVPAGGDLQAAINTAAAGDTILLEAGATYVGPFTLPVKSGSSYITIQSSGSALLPADGQRVTLANASAMPKLVSPGSGSPVLQTASAAHHFRFVGIEFMPRDASAFVYDLIVLGTGTQTLAEVPHDFIFDRCYVHALPGQGVKRGIALNSAFTEIRNSYISDFKVVGQDSQAICGWNGPGPFQIVNNYLEAAGENVMFGGADPSIPNLVPSDITIVNNSFFKPLSWRVGDPSYAGTHWSVKNLLEVKNAQRVTINGNTFENNWGDAEVGYAILFTPRNQAGGAPWVVVQDVQFTNNIVRHSGSGIQMLGFDTYAVSQQTKRVTIENNLFEDINGPKWGSEGKFLVMGGGGDQISFIHNTILQTGNITMLYGTPTTNFTFSNNIMPHNQYGFIGDNVGAGTATLNLYTPGAAFARNVIINAPAQYYPTNNYYPSLLSNVQFVDYANSNYRLASGSPYKNLATDGKDIGVDIDVLLASQNSITPTGIPTPSFFVRQHYLDFLNREPDASGLSFWVDQFTQCAGDSQCLEVKRVNVSAAFFLSIEFQQTGYFVERIYKTAYGDADALSALDTYPNTHPIKAPIIKFDEFLADTQRIAKDVVVGVGDWQAQLENNKVALTQEFVTRSRFQTAYPITMTPADFVDTLFQRTGVTPTAVDRTSIISEFGDAGVSADTGARARVLRLVAENAVLKQQETNKAFVLMQYFGYLRRDPNAAPDTDHTGYDFWVTKLNAFNGNFVNAEMVKSFILSQEYRARYGQ